MKAIYNALIERLKTITELRYIDMDSGQLEVGYSDTKRPPIVYPAALVTIDVARQKDITELSQLCSARITIRIADDTPMRTAAHQGGRSASLQIYDLIDDVRRELQGYTGGEIFSPLSCQSQELERSNGGLFIYKLTFDTTFLLSSIK
ncbi:MAG: hypothetical protein PUK66_07165 [Bacteroidales bacterium]|uniref:phage tail terminator protein n=1 Tax=Porphyromonas sp. TaxID=1924944 RepID=UPI00297B9ACC|nr:hypothetical protein [Porphyromonas sp.]MDD7438591.1 hypothetical protein [Bacteroidales bacterium]MDY3067847.1 hypothetical protein [Porphyromonas sp.]